jgi:hypothetical protein
MASDIAYDGFDYNSIQDYCEIDYQIDLFELRQYSKSKKQSKHKNEKIIMSNSSKNSQISTNISKNELYELQKEIKS